MGGMGYEGIPYSHSPNLLLTADGWNRHLRYIKACNELGGGLKDLSFLPLPVEMI